jgi:hypothetical protein
MAHIADDADDLVPLAIAASADTLAQSCGGR